MREGEGSMKNERDIGLSLSLSLRDIPLCGFFETKVRGFCSCFSFSCCCCWGRSGEYC